MRLILEQLFNVFWIVQKDIDNKRVASSECRRFLTLSAGYGITAAVVEMSQNALGSEEAADNIGRIELELKAVAQHTMILGSA